MKRVVCGLFFFCSRNYTFLPFSASMKLIQRHELKLFQPRKPPNHPCYPLPTRTSPDAIIHFLFLSSSFSNLCKNTRCQATKDTLGCPGKLGLPGHFMSKADYMVSFGTTEWKAKLDSDLDAFLQEILEDILSQVLSSCFF